MDICGPLSGRQLSTLKKKKKKRKKKDSFSHLMINQYPLLQLQLEGPGDCVMSLSL